MDRTSPAWVPWMPFAQISHSTFVFPEHVAVVRLIKLGTRQWLWGLYTLILGLKMGSRLLKQGPLTVTKTAWDSDFQMPKILSWLL